MKRLFTKIVLLSVIALFVFSPMVNIIGIRGMGVTDVYAEGTSGLDKQGLPNPCAAVGVFDLLTGDGGDIACNIDVFFIRVVWYGGTSVIAGLVGGAFDFFLFYTGQSTTYSKVDFILVGWGIVRDLSNIVLIAGLLFIAISMMLNNKLGDWKKMLTKLIIAALFINFSLFLTQIIVDASHVLARVFYNAIVVNTDRTEKARFMGQKYLALSDILLNQMDPQRLVSGEVKDQNSDSKLFYFTVYIIGGLINIMMIGVFTSILFLMIGRTIQLMFSMILSPFAFASSLLPQLKGQKYVSWEKWFDDLLKSAFMLPVFMFFMYLIALFINLSDDARVATALASDNLTGIELIINIVIPILLILGLVYAAKDAAKGMASSITSKVAGGVESATKWALGSAAALAIGATAVATGGATSALGSSLAKRGAAKIATGRGALAAAGTPQARARAKETINAGKRQLARGKWIEENVKSNATDIRKYGFNVAGQRVDLATAADKILGINIGKASSDTSTRASRLKAIQENYIKRTQEKVAIGTADIKERYEDKKGEQDKLKDIIKKMDEKSEKEFNKWVATRESGIAWLNWTPQQIARDKALKKKSLKADLLDPTVRTSETIIEDEDGNQITNTDSGDIAKYGSVKTYAQVSDELTAVKTEIKDIGKELVQESKNIIEETLKGIEGAFQGLGPEMRAVLSEGMIRTGKFGASNAISDKVTGQSEEELAAIRDKLYKSLKL